LRERFHGTLTSIVVVFSEVPTRLSYREIQLGRVTEDLFHFYHGFLRFRLHPLYIIVENDDINDVPMQAKRGVRPNGFKVRVDEFIQFAVGDFESKVDNRWNESRILVVAIG
jgi:hypothetical protein